MLNDTKQTETNLSLWKYLTDDAAKIKDCLWPMASWMFTIQAGITAFIAKHLKGESWRSLLVENKVMEISALHQNETAQLVPCLPTKTEEHL